MARLSRLLALSLLAALALGQSGLPAALAEACARAMMYREYDDIMPRADALRLVLRGDFGCGFFTELEELRAGAAGLSVAWLQASHPLLPLPTVSPGAVDSRPSGHARWEHQERPPGFKTEVEPPPPRRGWRAAREIR